MSQGWAGAVQRATRWLLGRKTATGPDAILGRRGEKHAAKLLQETGFAVLARNARVPMGEADIVCRDPAGRMVIVEVKSRLRAGAEGPIKSQHVAPEAAITEEKRRKLLAIARYLSKRNRWQPAARIDVVAVEFERVSGGEFRVLETRHTQDAVRG